MHLSLVFPVAVVLTLLFVLPSSSSPSTPLTCTTRVGAVRAAAAACQHFVNCRFEFGSGNAALTTTAWDVLLTTQTGLLVSGDPSLSSSSSSFPPVGVRASMFPANAVGPFLVYTNASDATAVDCDALALALASDPTLVPTGLWFTLATLIVHQTHASEDQACADLNEIPVLDNTTEPATVQYLCAPGKVCNMGNAWIYDLIAAVGIIVLVLAVVGVVFEIVLDALALRAYTRAQARLRRRWKKRLSETSDFNRV